MLSSLYDYQIEAVKKLKNGSILVGGVGSGKSRTSIAYYFSTICGEVLNSKFKRPTNLYIITTARKRDEKEWDLELAQFGLSAGEKNPSSVSIVVDSWNNIQKYSYVKNSFFIFDEQRVIGSGLWVKSFLKIVKFNKWILLSATPGDTWSDYIPVFIANGFYKNRTDFARQHIVYSRFSKFPKVDHYVGIYKLVKCKNSIIVIMHYQKPTKSHDEWITVPYNEKDFDTVFKRRWNIYKHLPIQDVSEMYYTARRVVNEDSRRIYFVKQLIKKHPKVIIFYNFNYEKDLLLAMANSIKIPISQWNGHKHDPIPKTKSWIYIVQYAAGAEGWNCIETDSIIFYSQNYSYKATVQAAGRIDRLNSPYSDLYYYHLKSDSAIDNAIKKSFDEKKTFNELDYEKSRAFQFASKT